MMMSALQTEVPPAVSRRGALGHSDLAEPALTVSRRPERYALRPLLRHYERAEAAGKLDSTLVAMIGEIDHSRIAGLLPPVPRRLVAARRAFAAELHHLIRLFVGAAKPPDVRIKLEIERDDRCRYFHTDRVGLRLLCTYLGPGTEWVPDEFANRSALGSGDNAAIVPDPTRVKRLAPFWVGLFKGDLHPDCPGLGCIHRSPSIGHERNAARILLTIDNPNED
jgi:Protein of unknown function (DUF1826)